jgi:release factor glutamine methyltransferase
MEHYDEREAENLLFMLFEAYTGIKKSAIFLNPETTVNESELLKIHFAIKELINHRPIQYILGETEFYNLKIKVNPDVLIPRPETEELVDIILKEADSIKVNSILDIGTGSGCIPIVLKKYLPNSKVSALEISSKAIETAKQNAEIQNVKIQFQLMNFLDRKQWNNLGTFDLIVSNPPYVSMLEKDKMGKNVLDYEPETALYVSNDDPIIFYRAISEFAVDHLSANGSMFCELNPLAALKVKDLFGNLQFRNLEIRKDLSGRDRFLIFQA